MSPDHDNSAPRAYPMVVVSNRLPVDYLSSDGDVHEWRTSPGGLVTALEPVIHDVKGAWVGWPGVVNREFDPFEHNDIHIVPVALSEDEVAKYYEGFANGTLWPLYHDVIAPPEFHREWWDAYVRVNKRFAKSAAEVVEPHGVVWVHDYQLQLVPKLLRELRPDVVIGFFNHIPFPPYDIYSQLPWRKQVIEGLLGADVIGFQRATDSGNFSRAVRQLLGHPTRNRAIEIRGDDGNMRRIIARHFPISIDARGMEALARSPAVEARAREIRKELGNPATLMLGIDRLDYTKGIHHRLKAYGELLDDGRLHADDTALIQVASPSRERVEAYQHLRDEIELTVGRINGEHSTIERQAITYLHHGYPREEMAALYLAADVMLVTALRDGMNLVAKEFVACNWNDAGVLVLSEFAGAADELKQAVLVNPHDIEGLKNAIMAATVMPEHERKRRMRSLRRRVRKNDVNRWSSDFLDTLTGDFMLPRGVSGSLGSAIDRLAEAETLLVALDFDGTLAPHVDDPDDARALENIVEALVPLRQARDTRVAFVSGRSLENLRLVAEPPPDLLLAGSHGVEFQLDDGDMPGVLHASERAKLRELFRILEAIAEGGDGAWVEEKAFGSALHTRTLSPARGAELQLQARTEVSHALSDLTVRQGINVIEFAVRHANKGDAIERLRQHTGATAVLFVGDDVTDEDAFAVLHDGDVGIKVGRGKTLAAHRIRSPEDVAELLSRLTEARLQRDIPGAGRAR